MLSFSQNYKLKLNSFCLYILVITMLIGPLVYLGVAALYHFVVIALLLLMLCKGINTANFKTDIMLFLVLWVAEALISVLWAPDKEKALQYVYYIFLIVAACVLFHCFLNKDNLIAFCYFMVILLLCCNLIAFWEMTTGNHLVKNYLTSQQSIRLLKYVPGGFYKNPNDFATFIIQIIPFSFMCISSKKVYMRVISIFNLPASFVTVCATQSRTQMVVILVMFLFFAIISNKKKLIQSGLIVCVALTALYYLYPNFKSVVNESLESVFVEDMFAHSATSETSASIRINLLKNAGYILLDTFGFGIGAGCHRTVILDYSAQYFHTAGVGVVHNLLGELFVDYGILVGTLFLVALAKSCYSLFKIYKTAQENDIRILAAMLVFFLAVFIICGTSSSSILQITSVWTTFCFCSAFIKLYKE